VPTYIVRLWLPDRPGALGQVASRIGAVRGEIVGIDILERGAGRAIDELAVDLPDPELVSLLTQEIEQVDGVDVEEIRPVAVALHDPRLDALETAAMLVGAGNLDELVGALVTHARSAVGAEWAAVLSLTAVQLVACDGPAPGAPWLAAFVEGSRTAAAVAGPDVGPEDVMWAPLPSSQLAVVVGRSGTAYRARERRQLSALARIVDTRHHELRRTASRHASR
jgi:23S rRNA U2552 (ribose-2'-O)-methylase RlmE/FtsJ